MHLKMELFLLAYIEVMTNYCRFEQSFSEFYSLEMMLGTVEQKMVYSVHVKFAIVYRVFYYLSVMEKAVQATVA